MFCSPASVSHLFLPLLPLDRLLRIPKCSRCHPGLGLSLALHTRMACPAVSPLTDEATEPGRGRPRTRSPCQQLRCLPAGAWRPRPAKGHKVCHLTVPLAAGRVVRPPGSWHRGPETGWRHSSPSASPEDPTQGCRAAARWSQREFCFLIQSSSPSQCLHPTNTRLCA